MLQGAGDEPKQKEIDRVGRHKTEEDGGRVGAAPAAELRSEEEGREQKN